MPNEVKKSELYPPWKELYDTYKEAPYGAFLSFNDISQKTHTRVYGKGWTWMIERFKKEMLTLSKRALESVHNKGYRIVNPNEHPRLVCRETKRAERRLYHGVELTKYIAMDELNDKDKMLITDLNARTMVLYAFMVKGVKKIKGITLHYDLPGIPRPQLESKNDVQPQS